MDVKELGFLFPGQGAQAVGMGQDFYERNPAARQIFDRADKLLHFPLSNLCFHGPDSDLTRTSNAQAAIFVTSMAALAALRVAYPKLKPSIACGLSLGEFTALVALEAISFEDGLILVRKRGELMDEANQTKPGTMASVIGLSIEACESICKETGSWLANLNGYDQIVLSGSFESVEDACRLAEARGAKRVIVLKVGGAFHSPLMQYAETGLKEALKGISIKQPVGQFIPNVTGEPVSDPETIRALLAEQLTSPVQWVKTMEYLNQQGPKDLLEIGPGRVLKGLARRVEESKLSVYNVERNTDIDGLKNVILNSAHAS